MTVPKHTSQVRLVPKRSGVRPIATLGRRACLSGGGGGPAPLSFPPINAAVAAAFHVRSQALCSIGLRPTPFPGARSPLPFGLANSCLRVCATCNTAYILCSQAHLEPVA